MSMHDHGWPLALAVPLLACVACTGPAEPPPPAPLSALPAPAPRHPLRAPVVVSVRGPEAPAAGQDVTLTVSIDRAMKAMMGAPLELLVTLPPGATLASGQLHEHIEGAAEH